MHAQNNPQKLDKGPGGMEIGGWAETIQTMTFLRSAEYWNETRRFQETCSHSESSGRQPADTGVENSQGVIIIATAFAFLPLFIFLTKTQKMVLDPSILNSQHYKEWIKGKVDQCRE